MLVGAMNHPRKDVLAEIREMASMGLEFIDLTLEPPTASVWRVDPRAIREELARTGLAVVGHTAYYLPIGSPFESLRAAAVKELIDCLRAFAEIGVKWMNVHPDRHAPMHDRAYTVQRNLLSLRELSAAARDYGIGVMVENLPGEFNSVEQLSQLLDPMPELGLHLDIGHANLLVPRNTTGELLSTYGSRVRHVHLHDNKGGGADLHLPLGAGEIAVKECLAQLKSTGYDATITLEVFSADRHYLEYSRDQLKRIWSEIDG